MRECGERGLCWWRKMTMLHLKSHMPTARIRKIPKERHHRQDQDQSSDQGQGTRQGVGAMHATRKGAVRRVMVASEAVGVSPSTSPASPTATFHRAFAHLPPVLLPAISVDCSATCICTASSLRGRVIWSRRTAKPAHTNQLDPKTWTLSSQTYTGTPALRRTKFKVRCGC